MSCPCNWKELSRGGIAACLPWGTPQAPRATLILQLWLGLCELPKVVQESPAQSADFECRNIKFLLLPSLCCCNCCLAPWLGFYFFSLCLGHHYSLAQVGRLLDNSFSFHCVFYLRVCVNP